MLRLRLLREPPRRDVERRVLRVRERLPPRELLLVLLRPPPRPPRPTLLPPRLLRDEEDDDEEEVSPDLLRCLFTVAAAICFARLLDLPRLPALCLMCSY